MTSRLVLRLVGDNARLGDLYASDLARLITGIEQAVGRAVEQLAGRAPSGTGPPHGAVARSVRLRLAGIEEGSIVLKLASDGILTDGEAVVQEALDLGDQQLIESAIPTVIEVVSGSESRFPKVTVALSRMSRSLDIGGRYRELIMTQPGDDPREAVLDITARKRLEAAARRRTHSDDTGTLDGILYEADFEKNTAKLRIPTGSSIKVRFTDDRALDIKEALRENSQVQGRITHNEATSSIVSVDLTEISLTEQMLMPNPEDFWITRSLEDLAKAQGVEAVPSFESLQDDTISDEEAEAFMAALGL